MLGWENGFSPVNVLRGNSWHEGCVLVSHLSDFFSFCQTNRGKKKNVDVRLQTRGSETLVRMLRNNLRL